MIGHAIGKIKPDEEKWKLFNYFLMDHNKLKHDNVITSSDGLYLVINEAKSIGMRPMQRKRQRNERPK